MLASLVMLQISTRLTNIVTSALNELESLLSRENYIQQGCLDKRFAVFANASSTEGNAESYTRSPLKPECVVVC